MDVKSLCLGALILGDASGYEIKKLFEDGPFAYFHAAGFGSIYPALNALHAAGQVTVHEAVQEGRPTKKVYTITPAGREAFRGALKKAPAADILRSEALFMLFFSSLLDSDHRSEIFADYLQTFRDALDRLDGPCRQDLPAGPRFVKGFGQAVYRAAVEYMESSRDLLTEDGQAAEAPQPMRGAGGAE